MRKKLKIETLSVESFPTLAIRGARGTVLAAGDSGTTVIPNLCYPDSNIMDCYEDPHSNRTCGCPMDP